MGNKTTYQLLISHRDKGLKQAYERYGKKLYGYAISVWKVDEDASWDLVYKSLYRVAEQVQNYHFENEDKFGGFLFRVFINYLKNHLRDNPKNQTVELKEHMGIEHNHPTQEIENPNHLLIRKELDRMEDWERILLLSRSQGMSYQEIANYTNKSTDQLKVYYGRLKKRLEKILTEASITINNTDHGK